MAKWGEGFRIEPPVRAVPQDVPSERPRHLEGDGYDSLRRVMELAVTQASKGKGRDRHASEKPFRKQPIMEIGRMVGVGYHTGQAMKKAQEAMRLPNGHARTELLGAINYLAAAYLLLEEQHET